MMRNAKGSYTTNDSRRNGWVTPSHQPVQRALPRTEQFNQAEMIREFDFGRKMAEGGIPWKHSPPGYAAPQGQVVQ